MAQGQMVSSAVAGSTPAAPLGRRAVARLIDFSIGVAMFVGAWSAFGAIAANSARDSALDVDGTGPFLVAVVLTFLLYLVYEVVMVAIFGRTLGKLAVGVRVVRVADGRRPGLIRSFLRNLTPTVVLVVFFPIYPLSWMIELLGDHRWPNDRLARTRVVLASAQLPDGCSGGR
jgi:uncharacterized RDD family membrane protein YckC